MNKLKIYFSFLIGLIVLVVFLVFRFRPKPYVPFFFNYFWVDPILVILIGIIIRKVIQMWINRSGKRKFGFFIKIQLFMYYLQSKWDDILVNFEKKIGEKFPIFFFKLTKFCHEFILWNYNLQKSKNFPKNILGKFLLFFFVVPVYGTFCLDVYLHQWHYVFWGFLTSWVLRFIFITLFSRLGRYYLFWFYQKYRPSEIDDIKDIFK